MGTSLRWRIGLGKHISIHSLLSGMSVKSQQYLVIEPAEKSWYPKNPWAVHGRGRTRHLRRGPGPQNPICLSARILRVLPSRIFHTKFGPLPRNSPSLSSRHSNRSSGGLRRTSSRCRRSPPTTGRSWSPRGRRSWGDRVSTPLHWEWHSTRVGMAHSWSTPSLHFFIVDGNPRPTICALLYDGLRRS